MSFSQNTLTALKMAAKCLARTDGSLANRLGAAEQYLHVISPGDLDAQSWAELVTARGNIKRGGNMLQLQRAADTVVDLLVRYSSIQHEQ